VEENKKGTIYMITDMQKICRYKHHSSVNYIA